MSGLREDTKVLGCVTAEYPYYLVGAVTTHPDSTSETVESIIVIAGGGLIILIAVAGIHLNRQEFEEPDPPSTQPTEGRWNSFLEKHKNKIKPYLNALLALADVTTDCLTAFKDLANSPHASGDLFPAAVVCLVTSTTIGLFGTAHYVFRATGDDGQPLMDRKSVAANSLQDGKGWYIWIFMLCATSPETLVLMPWTHRGNKFPASSQEAGPDAVLKADGLPSMHVAVFCTIAAASEDIPQLILQIIFVKRIAERTDTEVAFNVWASIIFSGLKLLHCVFVRYGFAFVYAKQQQNRKKRGMFDRCQPRRQAKVTPEVTDLESSEGPASKKYLADDVNLEDPEDHSRRQVDGGKAEPFTAPGPMMVMAEPLAERTDKPTDPAHEPKPKLINSMEALCQATNEKAADLLKYPPGDLDELFIELGVTVVGKNKIRREMDALRPPESEPEPTDMPGSVHEQQPHLPPLAQQPRLPKNFSRSHSRVANDTASLKMMMRKLRELEGNNVELMEADDDQDGFVSVVEFGSWFKEYCNEIELGEPTNEEIQDEWDVVTGGGKERMPADEFQTQLFFLSAELDDESMSPTEKIKAKRAQRKAAMSP